MKEKVEEMNFFQYEFKQMHFILSAVPFLALLSFMIFCNQDLALFNWATEGYYTTFLGVFLFLHVGTFWLGHFSTNKVKDESSSKKWSIIMMAVYCLSTVPATVIIIFPSVARILFTYLC